MATIDIKNLTFGYPGSDEILFSDINLRIDTSWKLGIIGRNGRGKSTFLKILRGQLEYEGRITGCPDFNCFPLQIDNEYDLGIDIIRSVSPNAQDWEIRREMNYLELDEDVMYSPYCILSGGEKTKLQLISLFLNDSGFPLIDEPTNHLDTHGREVTANYLKRQKGFILISHDRSFLDLSTDHTMAINKSNVEVSPVSYSTWWEQNEIKLRHEEAQNEKLKKDIARLRKAEEAAEQWSNAAERSKIGFDPRKVEKSISRRSYEGAKSAKMMSHAKNIERRFENKIEQKSSLLKNKENREALKITGTKHYADLLIKATNLVLYYNNTPICEPINIELHSQDRIALNGTNGCGKSSFIKLITGNYDTSLTYTGELYKASGISYSCVAQDTSSLVGTPTDYAYEVGVDQVRFKSILRKMGFGQDNLMQDMASLSEGQKKIILIAASLCEEKNVFVWDEPLNYIDIYIRQTIEEMLASSDITMLFVEHDKSFAESIATDSYTITRKA